MVNRLVLCVTSVLAAASVHAADFSGPAASPVPRPWAATAVVGFEPASIERLEVVRIPPARRFIVLEDRPAVLYAAPVALPPVAVVPIGLPRGVLYNAPVRFEPILYRRPCLC
jgi:hypothetical protein